MASFSNKNSQAERVLQILSKKIESVGTNRNYREALINIAHWSITMRLGGLKDLSLKDGINYLEVRAEEVSQASLDKERQALQCMLIHVNHELRKDEKLPFIKSLIPTSINPRVYTERQVLAIANRQSFQNALPTLIAYDAGIRAHEFYNIHLYDKSLISKRDYRKDLFLGRGLNSHTQFVVKGKGGLWREVRVIKELANILMALLLDIPIPLIDRRVNYKKKFDLSGGNAWSSSFSQMSKKELGFSHGAHGLRHSYAENRMLFLKHYPHLTFDDRLEILSQELGHFRPSIAYAYLR